MYFFHILHIHHFKCNILLLTYDVYWCANVILFKNPIIRDLWHINRNTWSIDKSVGLVDISLQVKQDVDIDWRNSLFIKSSPMKFLSEISATTVQSQELHADRQITLVKKTDNTLGVSIQIGAIVITNILSV